MPIINITTYIKADRKIVFDLARSIDFHQMSTHHTNEKAIAGVTTGLVQKNDWVTWRAKHFGIYQNLTSVIPELDAPNYFVDEMKKGAFKRFKHQHFFKDYKDGTEMIDVFDYQSPLGFLGKIADKLFLKKYMTNFLTQRNLAIKDYAESEKWKTVLKP